MCGEIQATFIKPAHKILSGSVVRYDENHPYGYHGGTFSAEALEKAEKSNIPLTLDLAIPGKCLNNCVFCGYYKVNTTGKLTPSEIGSIFRQFKNLGGESIKILGEGEPLLRTDILDLVEDIHRLGLTPVLFTCGDVIGDDKLAKKIHGVAGYEIALRLKRSECTVILKYEGKYQDDIVQQKGFSTLRNRALKMLLELEFNSFFPSRLGFGTVLLRKNIREIPKIFRYALENNIYPLICPLMPIGKTKEKECREQLAPSREETREHRNELVAIRSKYGINHDAVSDFPGGLPCDVARAGFYIDDVGKAFLCESDEFVGNIRDQSLKILWGKINSKKDKKYGKARFKGLCFPKRMCEII